MRHSAAQRMGEYTSLCALADLLPGALYQYRRAPGGRRRLHYANPLLVELADGALTDFETFIARRVSPPDHAGLVAALEAAENRLEPLRHELRVITAGGERRMETRASFARADDGSVVAHGIILDCAHATPAPLRPATTEEGFQQLYQRTPIMLQSLDRDGTVIAVSDYWLDHLGYSRKEVLGRHASAFVPAESGQAMPDEILSALTRHGRCKDVSSRLMRKDGGIIEVLVSADAELDANGRLLRSRSVLIDVTEQRRAEANYRDIFENSTEGVYRATADGRLLRVNPALARMHGFESEDEVLASIGDLASDWYADADTHSRIRERLARDGRVEDFEAEVYCRATGERIWTSENARAVCDGSGDVAYIEGTVRDITAQYKARQLATRRSEILEMIARDAPQIATLYEIIATIEHHWGRLTAAIFRVHEGRLYATAAPGLANACIRAVDGALPAELDRAVEGALQ